MDPLLAKIRAQLSSETLSFGLLVRGEVLKEQLSAFTKLAHVTEESTQKEPGNLLYRFFFSAQDPLARVCVAGMLGEFSGARCAFRSDAFQAIRSRHRVTY